MSYLRLTEDLKETQFLTQQKAEMQDYVAQLIMLPWKTLEWLQKLIRTCIEIMCNLNLCSGNTHLLVPRLYYQSGKTGKLKKLVCGNFVRNMGICINKAHYQLT